YGHGHGHAYDPEGGAVKGRGRNQAPARAAGKPVRSSNQRPRTTSAETVRGTAGAKAKPRAGAAQRSLDKPRGKHAARSRNEERFVERAGPQPRKAARPEEPSAPRPSPEVVKPRALSLVGPEPHPGMWLFTTREGSEQDLVDELLLAKVVDPAPRVLGPALVLSPKLPKREGQFIGLTFARQGFEIVQSVKSHDLDEVTQRIARSLRNKLAQTTQYALHVWVPDSTEGNPLSSLAEELDARLARTLSESLPNAQRIDDASLRRLGSVQLAQVAVLDPQRFVAGVMYGNRTPSLAKGGRTRVRVAGDLPSRAARKLEEALAWIGVAPGPGELCADLGAAPGGWTYVLAERRARVIAVDPAKLRPDILAKKGVRHVQESAFTFTPDEPVDWLFCDMAWRPLEAAALLAKWGRKRWARIVVANIKLPMTRKAEILARVRTILEREGEWKHVRAKQLYHDRDEITLTALRS
ncbi:MAG TPA: 23S rRNA (cytidine(2498)-2'-O)-methyltransferase RlmM, partial [Polyangiales bacterium]